MAEAVIRDGERYPWLRFPFDLHITMGIGYDTMHLLMTIYPCLGHSDHCVAILEMHIPVDGYATAVIVPLTYPAIRRPCALVR